MNLVSVRQLEIRCNGKYLNEKHREVASVMCHSLYLSFRLAVITASCEVEFVKLSYLKIE